MMNRSSSLSASVSAKPISAIMNRPTYICSTAKVSHALQIRNPSPLFAPIISAIAIRISPMPMPSLKPVMITGSAPGSAMVQNMLQRSAL